jgi:hypothetical protein
MAATSREKKMRERSRTVKDDARKNQAAVALGRLGGEKGGRARAESMTPEERSESARRAAQARWRRRA